MGSGVRQYHELLSKKAATGSSDWVDVSESESITVEVNGISGDTVQIHGTNRQTRPSAPTTDGVVLLSITADDIYVLAGPIGHLKAKVSTYSAGSINVWVRGI